MKGLFYLVVTMVVIIACTNEEFDANSEVKKEEVKTKIASLAEKYDVNVDFFEINPSEKTENEMSLEEIEELFRDIKQLREHPVELKKKMAVCFILLKSRNLVCRLLKHVVKFIHSVIGFGILHGLV